MIRFHTLRDWIIKELNVKQRIQIICFWYVLSLMMISRKHSLEFAAEVSGSDKSQFSRFLKDHFNIAVLTLTDLSKRRAKEYSKALEKLKSLPWKVAFIIDLTGQGRSSRHSDNVQKHNHGNGYFVGHQWTNIILLINDMIIPLPPIAFYSKKYCRENGMEYKSEHLRVIEYLQSLELWACIQEYHPEDVVVLADSGYDDHRIEKAVMERGWDFIIPLKIKRSVKSNPEYLKTKHNEGWKQVKEFFKAHRWLKWETVRLFTSGEKRRRKEFRIRHTIGWLKKVGPVQLVCSEKKKAARGERKYFACSHLTVKPRQILVGYGLRWTIELFHKAVKMHLGFEDVSTKSFDSVIAHVHWVYCAYILLHSELPGISSSAETLSERQRYVMSILVKKEKANLLQQLTQIGGVVKQKNELKRALAA